MQDTIAAIATAPGMGAIAVIRLSGNAAISLTDTLFVSPKQGKSLSTQKANTIHFGGLVHKGETIDEVLVSLFRAPHSYTGEDSIEISCHGSTHIQQRILQALIDVGARLAEPGEFTLRAFLNGKIDLSQAEAVADLIGATSEAERKIALHQMRGGFSKVISELRGRLLGFISLVELELDFSEEDVQFADRTQLAALIVEIQTVVNHLMASFSLGNVLKRGISVAIAGKPNVGKSTLLNALLNEEKAIVSEVAGTTRDVIEDTIVLHGINFRFIDTAGLRQTTDLVESIGIERAYTRIRQANIVLLLVEATEETEEINLKISEIEENIKDSDGRLVVVLNKSDLNEKTASKLAQIRGLRANDSIVSISAKHKQGIDILVGALLENVALSKLESQDVIVSNIRHYQALSLAAEALDRAQDGIRSKLTTDLLAQDIRQSLYYLGTITGEISTDEILGNIFANFCIGK
jgi:tRNA modification GTPase